MAASEKVQKLRLVLGGLAEPQAREVLQAPDLPCGIPRGILVELLGTSRVEWFLKFLKMNPELKVFWCEQDQRVLPTAIHQRGVGLDRITFGLLGEDMKKALRQILQRQVHQIILAPNKFTEISTLKAFQLLTEKANATVFLLGDKKPSTAWPISMQLEIQRAENNKDFDIEILRHKHGAFL